MVRSRRGPNRARRGGGARGHDDVVDAGLARGEAELNDDLVRDGLVRLQDECDFAAGAHGRVAEAAFERREFDDLALEIEEAAAVNGDDDSGLAGRGQAPRLGKVDAHAGRENERRAEEQKNQQEKEKRIWESRDFHIHPSSQPSENVADSHKT
mgnify:CR=1 FL=1